jgi:hypothetical protein
MEINDSLNNQFRLYNYVNRLNANLLQYLDNNNIDINYYCFFSEVINEKHYIITSETTKRVLNGYRLITIQDVDKDKDNRILEYNDNLDIIFENIHIKVTSIINDIDNIAKKFDIIITNFDNKLADNAAIDFQYNYNKNILESNITKVMNIIDINILNNFEILKELHFYKKFNQPISENVLPDTLQMLIFGFHYNQIIGINVLPNSLQTLIFGYYYNQIIGINVLPNSLQTLTFGSLYNQTIDVNVLPNLLQTLTFGSVYDQTISKNVLPNSLQALTFSHFYDQTFGINVLPNSLQSLTFNYNYNQIISENILPISLKVIYFNFCGKKKYNKKYIVPQIFKNIVKYISF